MDAFLHQVLAGLATGGIYASLALALVLIYQATHLVNFAQGEMAMFSTYIAWSLINAGMPYWPAFLLTVGIAFILGILIERIVVRPVENAPVLVVVVVFIGLLVILNSVAGWIYTYTIKSFQSPFPRQPILGIHYISAHELGAIGVTLAVLALLYAFFRFTPLGLAMRAAAQNPESSRLVGIRVGWMLALGWGLAASVGAVAGMMVAPVVYLDPNMMGKDPFPRRPDRRCLRAAFPGQQLSHLSAHAGAGVRHRAARAQHPHRLQRPDLPRPRRLLRPGRLLRGDPHRQGRRAVLGSSARRRRRLPRCRVPVRAAGAAPGGALSRARHLRARRGDAAAAEVPSPREVDRRRAGHRHRETRSPVRNSAGGGQVAVLLHPGCDPDHVCTRLEPAAWPHRARPGCDPRPAHRVRGDGHLQRALQVACIRSIGHVHRRRGRPWSARRAVRRPRQLRRLPFDRVSRRHRGGRPRLDQRRSLRRAVHPVHPEHRRRDLEGRPLGDLRRVHDRFRLPDAQRRGRRHPAAFDEEESTTKTKLVCIAPMLAAFAFPPATH